MNLDDLQYDEHGLMPVIVQDAGSGEVLTLAYANREALAFTMESGFSHFYSRSRKCLWKKGETSGHLQNVVEVRLDCDQDAVLYRVVPHGPACHTGKRSCFFTTLGEREVHPALGEVLQRVYHSVQERITRLPEGSYVAGLHQQGLDRLLRKIGEEAGEVIIAAKNADMGELSWESSDLLFHLLFVITELGLSPDDLADVLWRRHLTHSAHETT